MQMKSKHIWAVAISMGLAGFMAGDAYADLPPTPPPPDMPKPKPAPAPKPNTGAANAKSTAPDPNAAAMPSAVPLDPNAAVLQEPQLTEKEKAFLAIKWQPGPVTGALGTMAEVNIPEGYFFVDGDGTRKFLELNENLTNGKELGTIASGDFKWFVVFEFSDIGYVKDDEKADLDADALLNALREGNEAGNRTKRARGWRTLTLTGWAQPPRYDAATNNLEWAPQFQDDVDKSMAVNHFIRLLGRDGVMEVSLVTSPEEYQKNLADTRTLLAAYSFKGGHKYSEFRQGDKIAAIGLAGLITGGAVAAAAKTGVLAKIFAKGGKLIVAAGAAIAAGIAKLFGRKKDSE